jgi:hypothetical protein
MDCTSSGSLHCAGGVTPLVNAFTGMTFVGGKSDEMMTLGRKLGFGWSAWAEHAKTKLNTDKTDANPSRNIAQRSATALSWSSWSVMKS